MSEVITLRCVKRQAVSSPCQLSARVAPTSILWDRLGFIQLVQLPWPLVTIFARRRPDKRMFLHVAALAEQEPREFDELNFTDQVAG